MIMVKLNDNFFCCLLNVNWGWYHRGKRWMSLWLQWQHCLAGSLHCWFWSFSWDFLTTRIIWRHASHIICIGKCQKYNERDMNTLCSCDDFHLPHVCRQHIKQHISPDSLRNIWKNKRQQNSLCYTLKIHFKAVCTCVCVCVWDLESRQWIDLGVVGPDGLEGPIVTVLNNADSCAWEHKQPCLHHKLAAILYCFFLSFFTS